MIVIEGGVTKQPITKRFDMTQTPDITFNKKTFAWAIDVAWDFKKDLFDCIAGLKPETEIDKRALDDLAKFVDGKTQNRKLGTEKDSATWYLANLVIFCKHNPNSQKTKAFVELWKQIYLLFPTKNRPIESVPAFKCLLTVKDVFESTKAQYYIMHAFAYYTDFGRQADKTRALTALVNNENATVADLMGVLEVRSDMDERIARAIVEKCHRKVVELEKLPAELRDNRPSSDKAYDTRHTYKIKSACLDGIHAVRILLNICPKYAVEMKDFFEKALDRATVKPKVVMPDINDLTQFPNYARVLNLVKEEEKVK